MKHTPIDSEDIAALICEYSSSGYTLEEAKKLRELNIACRKKPSTKGKWGECSWGNSGDCIWFGNGKVLPPKDLKDLGTELEGMHEVNCWLSTTDSAL